MQYSCNIFASPASGEEAMAFNQWRFGKYTRSQMYHRRGLWALMAKYNGWLPRPCPADYDERKPDPPPPKILKFYPADDEKKSRPRKKLKPTKLRASITPGTVLILLAGRYRGKRVIFLKQLSSGMLLITGPFKINGVPLRRVNQAYVIGTSTKVDISALDVDKVDDYYFPKKGKKKKTKGEGKFFGENNEVLNLLPREKIGDQKIVDNILLKEIAKTPYLKAYLGARFSLKAGMKPHELVF